MYRRPPPELGFQNASRPSSFTDHCDTKTLRLSISKNDEELTPLVGALQYSSTTIHASLPYLCEEACSSNRNRSSSPGSSATTPLAAVYGRVLELCRVFSQPLACVHSGKARQRCAPRRQLCFCESHRRSLGDRRKGGGGTRRGRSQVRRSQVL